METIYNAYSSSGLTIITVLYEDATHGTADTSDAASWESSFGLTFPVLADTSLEAYGLYFQGAQPSYVVFDRDMTIMAAGTGSELLIGDLQSWAIKLL